MKKPIALVTGASGGIGGAIAKALLKSGYAVALQYHRHAEAAQALISDCSPDADYLLLPCDLTDSDAVAAFADVVHKRFGPVSVLVNCAGIALKQMLFTDTTDADLASIFETNVYGPMRLTRLLLDDLRKTSGTIVNISSMWGVSGASCEVIYSASKAALIGFTKALAKELAPSGVTVNAVAPGFVSTAMNEHLSASDAEAFRSSTPLERFGTPQEIADAVLYLIGARFVTGQILSVDGGINI